MPIFAVTYVYANEPEALDALRPEHRAFLAEQSGLLLSGPTDDGGAFLVFEAATADEVEEILDGDPFDEANLIVERSVVGWTPVLGSWKGELGI